MPNNPCYNISLMIRPNPWLWRYGPRWKIWVTKITSLTIFLLCLCKPLIGSLLLPTPSLPDFLLRAGGRPPAQPSCLVVLSTVVVHSYAIMCSNSEDIKKWLLIWPITGPATPHLQKIRYSPWLISQNLYPRSNEYMHFFAYKYWKNLMEFLILLYNFHLATNFSSLSVYAGVLWNPPEFWLLGISTMEKGKEKVGFGGMLLSDQSLSHLNNMKTSLNKANNPATNSPKLPNLQPLSRGSPKKPKTKKNSGSNPRFDPTAMFNKLAAARENGKKKKELTLVDFLIGEPREFPRLFAKLRMDWRPLKGSLSFSILKSGWFEIAFSNQANFHRVWMNRLYHIFSQLLLLKLWYSGFDPTTESISQLDLWVRLHYLPEEFTNADALETIIEGNYIGKFLKMDLAHNSERWNMFTRFCINIDVEKTMGKGVIVLDEHFNKLKYSLWFDDFSPGCGACGKTAHVFKDCPHKNAPIPTLHITLKNPPSKNRSEEENYLNATNQEDWKQVGKNNKVIEPHPSFQLPSNNFYLSERGGVEILYESEESDEGFQSFFQESDTVNIQENLISVAADLHPYNRMSEDNNIQKARNSGGGVPENPHSPIKTSENNQEIKSNNFIGESSKVQAESSYDKNKVPETKSSLTDNQSSPSPPEPNNLNKSTQEQWPTEVLEDYEDEQFDYEYDDLLVEDTLEPEPTTFPLPSVEEDERNPILMSEDPSFTEQDLEDFINNEPAEPDLIPITSEGSFHSLQNSLLSTSSFVMELGKLGVENVETSNSHSSKRKEVDGVEDTASSSKIGKKSKTPLL